MSVYSIAPNNFFDQVAEATKTAGTWISETFKSVYERLKPHLEKLGEWFKNHSDFVWTAVITAIVTVAATLGFSYLCSKGEPVEAPEQNPQNPPPANS